MSHGAIGKEERTASKRIVVVVHQKVVRPDQVVVRYYRQHFYCQVSEDQRLGGFCPGTVSES